METVDLSLDIVGNPGRLEDIHPILPDPARSQPLHPHGGGAEAGGLSPHKTCASRLLHAATDPKGTPQGGCKRRGRAGEGGRNKKASLSVIDYEEW